MKPIIFVIASLVLSLPNFTINDDYMELESFEKADVIQNDIYLTQSLIVKSETLDFITCESCHGDLDTYPTSLLTIEYLENNFDASLIVHQQNNPHYISGLEQFLNNHDEDEAWAKYVDYLKVLDIVENR